MKTYAYIRAEVRPAAEAGEVELFMKLSQSNVKAPLSPGQIRFKHAIICAESDNEAYLLGGRVMPPLEAGYVMNDYVVCME